MGEEAKQQEAKTENKAEEKKENKAEEKKENKAEEKKENKAEEKTEEKKEESPEEKKEEPKPPSPVVLFVDLHCVGCAKKIERSIMKVRGVEEVVMDMSKNHITIKGIVEPQALCKRIQKKTKRRPKILSPLPSAEGDPLPQVVTSQVSAPTTVELNVNMHCEACAEQLKRKILKMRGVQMAETELASGKVKVTGTMDPNRLVDYVYRRTKKQARIVPQPEEPVPVPVTVTEKKEDKEDSKAEEKPAEETAEKKMDGNDKENPEKKGEDKGAEAEAKKGEEEEGSNKGESEGKKEDGNENKDEKENEANNAVDAEDIMRRRMFQYYNYYPPLYVIERVPPPQLFSDENPNACCIS